MHHETVDYKDGDTVLEAYISYDDSADSDEKKPLILIAHDWSGRRQFATETADTMAELGYVGFAVDMYGKGVFGEDGNVDLNSSLMNPLANDRAALRRRMLAALKAGLELPQVDSSKVAAMGFCFGGMCVLELARAGAKVRGVVSIHGLLTAGDVANEEIKAKVLCLHGHDDPMVPPEQVLAFETEMTGANVDWQLHAYGQTLHAFTNPRANNPKFGAQYSDRAKRRAYLNLESFFEEVLL
tara:strand:- start:3551 stop:4273 length:723 start_codon:yes stop_codon:yes gene_type:complete